METCAGRYLPWRRFFSVRLIMNVCFSAHSGCGVLHRIHSIL